MIKISEVLTEFSIPTGKSIDENKAEKEKIFNMLVKRGDTPVDARYEVDKSYDFVKKRFPRASVSKKAEIISALSKYESVKKEGTCGYGLDGKLGEEPAGPNLRKKIKDISKDKNESRNKSLGEKDLMNYLMKRFKFNKKKAIDTMKKAGFDTSMLKESSKEYGKSLDKIANDKKLKAISNKDKELLKKLAKLLQKESVNEAKYKGYDYKRQNRKDGLPLIVPALQKTFSNMKDLKKYIDKHGKMEGFDLEEACQKGYMTHPTRKTKIMFGKRYRNCVKKEGVDTTITLEQAGRIMDNICVNCGDFTNENLRKWFKDKWVNIGKKDKDGKHPPCGSSGKKRGYAKCVPASKARGMSKKQKASATRRKRAAQNKAGRGGTSSLRGGGKKPIRVSTKPKK